MARDGLQRISVAPDETGIALAWTTGRTDRRKDNQPHGVEWAEIHLAPDAKALVADRPHTYPLPQFRKEIDPNTFTIPHQPPDSSLMGAHIFFVRLQQADGNHAWSSPLWLTVQR
jgi:hypothetical protein